MWPQITSLPLAASPGSAPRPSTCWANGQWWIRHLVCRCSSQEKCCSLYEKWTKHKIVSGYLSFIHVSFSLTPREFNSYGARRGNDAVMTRGTFASIKLQNRFIGKAGPKTLHIPSGQTVSANIWRTHDEINTNTWKHHRENHQNK